MPRTQYLLFGGHRGCGKSTELRAIAQELAGPERFMVLELDVLSVLDINNLRYSDIILAQARLLAEQAQQEGIYVPSQYMRHLEDWFKERLLSRHRSEHLRTELATGAEATGGLPWLGGLFAKLTASISTNATYKEEVRQIVRDSFSQLAQGFNHLLSYITKRVAQMGRGHHILFVIDGTDRLSHEDAVSFFIENIHQLRQVCANTIYCAPITMLSESGQAATNFDAVFRLPMVKLMDKGATSPEALGWNTMEELITRRLPMEHFEDNNTLHHLISISGGHPRDLLRLVNLCFQELDNGPITRAIAETASQRLADEYRRLVQENDFEVLRAIDAGGKDYAPVSEQTRRLLYDLVLLEYNSFWWQTHPAVRMLPGYQRACQS